jgi:hypothetical protein
MNPVVAAISTSARRLPNKNPNKPVSSSCQTNRSTGINDGVSEGTRTPDTQDHNWPIVAGSPRDEVVDVPTFFDLLERGQRTAGAQELDLTIGCDC